MKIGYKRILTASLAVVMLFGAGCSSKGEESTTTTQPDTNGNLLDSINKDDENNSSGAGYYNLPFENPETDAKVEIQNGRFVVKGNEIWFNSVNTPWDNWNDFGGNFDEAFWDSHFAQLKKTGANATRIWFNCNGMVGVKLNEDGSFNSVTDKHWKDVDKLFELAAKHEIYIMATMLSFDHFKNTNQGYDAWRKMLRSSDNIDSFVNGYIVPFVKRYDANDYLWSIDLMNEPDWVFENEECGKLPWDNISDYFARASAKIHENSDVLVTVGFGIIKYNSEKYQGNKASKDYLSYLSKNDKSYVDFNSVHYYYWQKRWFGFPFEQSPEDFGLDASIPNVIGECASLDEDSYKITDKYLMAVDNGWDGAFAWTSNGVDGCGGYADITPALSAVKDKIPDKVFPLGCK